jgi:hypothetical protein
VARAITLNSVETARFRVGRHGTCVEVLRGIVSIPRSCALFLVILIALPFTAPFSTCDLATMLAAPAPHATAPSLVSVKSDDTARSAVVTMEYDDHVCVLATPYVMPGSVAVIDAAACTAPVQDVVRTAPLPLRL